MANTKPKGGLTAWFGKGKKGDWVDIGAPKKKGRYQACLLYTSPSPRDATLSRMPSSA